MISKPQKTETVKVRVAVLIDADGEYSALGSSRFAPGASRELLELLEDEHQNVSGNGYHLRHVKFLEIELPLPDARPVNLEAQPPSERHPATGVSDGPVLRKGDE